MKQVPGRVGDDVAVGEEERVAGHVLERDAAVLPDLVVVTLVDDLVVGEDLGRHQGEGKGDADHGALRRGEEALGEEPREVDEERAGPHERDDVRLHPEPLVHPVLEGRGLQRQVREGVEHDLVEDVRREEHHAAERAGKVGRAARRDEERERPEGHEREPGAQRLEGQIARVEVEALDEALRLLVAREQLERAVLLAQKVDQESFHGGAVAPRSQRGARRGPHHVGVGGKPEKSQETNGEKDLGKGREREKRD